MSWIKIELPVVVCAQGGRDEWVAVSGLPFGSRLIGWPGYLYWCGQQSLIRPARLNNWLTQWNGYHYPKSIYGANIRMYLGKGEAGQFLLLSKLFRYIYCGQMQIQKSFPNHRSGGTAHHVRLCVFLNMAFVSSVEPERLSVCSRWVLLCRII